MFSRLYGWYGKRNVWIVILIILTLIIIGLFIKKSHTVSSGVLNQTKVPEVTVASVSELATKSTFSVVGTVRAVSEAKLQAESGGRITAVNVNVGDRVTAGTVLATIENSREQAQLLQAEGAYEAALAGSKSSTVNLEESKVAIENLNREAYSVAENTILNLTDEFFTRPGTPLSGYLLTHGNPRLMNSERMDIGSLLADWSAKVQSGMKSSTPEEMLQYIESSLERVNTFTSSLYSAVSDESVSDGRYSDAELTSYKSRLSGARGSLQGELSAVSQARRTYEQAKVAGLNPSVSQAGAQLKTALGTLRNAQVSYEKTLIRTPISGTVNALYLKKGEYASMGQAAAIVANNGSLEISTSLSEMDAALVKRGDTVSINNSTRGTVTALAPAIDPGTGKIEVRIEASESATLLNGSTATITFTRNDESNKTDDETIVVPLKAVKLLPSGPVAYRVDEGELVAIPVTLGQILGDTVEIKKGLTTSDTIVTDARGRKAGEKVTVITIQ